MFEKPQRLHPAAIVVKIGPAAQEIVKGLIPAIVVAFTSSRSSHISIAVLVGLVTAGIVLLSIISPIVHYLSTTFYVDHESLIINTGFIWKKNRNIPLARIQNVNIERGIWHRILNAAAVKVETAAGKHTEGELAAVSLENAEKLQSILLQHRELDVPQEEQGPPAIVELSLKRVLLAGMLRNRLLYIVGSIFAVSQSEGVHKLWAPVIEHFAKLDPISSMIYGALSVLGLIVLGWAVSVAISATRFYGFRIERHERGLLILHGLITKFKSIVPLGRLQSVRIVEPPLYRAYDYVDLRADTAGSFDQKDAATSNTICPILERSELPRIGQILLPEFASENLDWRRVSLMTIPRHAWRTILFFLFIAGPMFYFWRRWPLPLILSIAIAVILFAFVRAFIAYRTIAYAHTADLLVGRRGVFQRETIILPFDRVQHYTIRASFFQRLQGLATVQAVTASSSHASFLIEDIERHQAERLREQIGEAVLSHLGRRRGGL